MANNIPYTDLIVDEPDGIARINLTKKDGSLFAADLKVEISSPILQAGSPFGAAELNTFINRDENGIITSTFITKGEW